METLTLPALFGILAPVLVAVITRAHWTSQVKRWAALGVYAALGVLAWAVTRFPNAGSVILAELTMVVAAGQVAYAAVKPTGILDWVEQATTPTQGGAGDAD